MKKSVTLIISCVLCVVIAVVAYFWVTGMISSNYAFRSPIKDTPPAPGQALGESSTHRVVIVLIDALRYDTSTSTAMPTLNQLREEGAQAKMHSQAPSFSEPGYTTILTGAWPWINDGPAFNLDYEEIPTWTQDNLFSAAHRAGLTTAISGYYWFEKLVPQSDVDISFYTPGEDRKADEDVMAAALPMLKDNKAQLVLIHIDQVDYAGHHEGGPVSQNWTNAAKRADDMLAQVVSSLDLSKDTLLVLSDHGQINPGGHGGQDPICLEEPFVLVGAGVVPGDYGDVNMVDVAPTLAALLGTNIPASTQGQVLTSMLQLPDSVKSAIPAAVEAQQAQLLNTFASAINRKAGSYTVPTGSDVNQYQTVMNELRQSRQTSERIPRAIAAVLFVGLIIFWLVKNFKQGSIGWIIGGLVFVGLFYFVYAIWEQQGFSVSYIKSEPELILRVALTAASVFVISFLMIFMDQKYFKYPPAEAVEKSLGLVLTTAFITGIPAILHFVINGPLVTWTLPNYLVSFLFILSGIDLLVIAFVGLLFVWFTYAVSKKVNSPAVKKPAKKVAK